MMAVAHNCNPRAWEVQKGKIPGVGAVVFQPGLLREFQADERAYLSNEWESVEEGRSRGF